MIRSPRRGSLILEVVMASVILGTLLVLSVNVLTWTLRERASGDRRAMALQEAANVLEETTNLDWAAITEERLAEFQLSPEFVTASPASRLRVSLRQPADDPTAKQITVVVESPTVDDAWEPLARLTAWSYRIAEGRP